MAYLDSLLLLDDNSEHLTTGASTNSIDLGENRDLGAGEDLYAVIIVDTAFTDSGSDSTMAITLETDDNSAFSSPATAQTLGTFPALSAVNSKFIVKLQPDVITERILRGKYTVANGNLTTGKFTFFLTKDIDNYKSFPDGFTIS